MKRFGIAIVGLSILVLFACLLGSLATLALQGPQESEITIGEAQGIVGQIMDDDARLLTYLAQQSDMLNRGYLRQAMPYTFLGLGAMLATVLVLFTLAVAWKALEVFS